MAHTLWMRPQFAGLDELSWLQEMYFSGLSGNAVWKRTWKTVFPGTRRPPIAPSFAAPPPPARSQHNPLRPWAHGFNSCPEKR